MFILYFGVLLLLDLRGLTILDYLAWWLYRILGNCIIILLEDLFLKGFRRGF